MRRDALGAGLVAVCLWGLAPVATRAAVGHISPLPLLLIRLTAASLVLLPWALPVFRRLRPRSAGRLARRGAARPRRVQPAGHRGAALAARQHRRAAARHRAGLGAAAQPGVPRRARRRAGLARQRRRAGRRGRADRPWRRRGRGGRRGRLPRARRGRPGARRHAVVRRVHDRGDPARQPSSAPSPRPRRPPSSAPSPTSPPPGPCRAPGSRTSVRRSGRNWPSSPSAARRPGCCCGTWPRWPPGSAGSACCSTSSPWSA